jgi:hypothetical protein
VLLDAAPQAAFLAFEAAGEILISTTGPAGKEFDHAPVELTGILPIETILHLHHHSSIQ